MPNHRHQRNHRQKDEDAHNNNNQHGAAIAAPQPREAVGAGSGMAHQGHHHNDNAGARLQKCCCPGVCRSPDELIDPETPFDAVKVICNNETCNEGSWMHKDCFEDFELSVLAYLRSCGRARSWSEKQRLQNLWTKKGYDLAFKACDCKCSRGHVRKDLDYIPPPFNENAKKQKKHKKKNDKPMPVVSTTHKSNSHSNHVVHQNGNGNTTTPNPHTNTTTTTRGQQNHVTTNGVRTEKKSKKPATTTSVTTKTQDSPRIDNTVILQQQQITDNQHSKTPTTTNPTPINNQLHFPGVLPGANPQLRLRTNSVSSTGSAGSHSSSSSVPSSAGSPSPISSSPVSGDMFFKNRKSSDASSDSGSSSMSGFRHRQDLSAFSSLPRCKQNAYHIRMEDAATLAYAFSACSVASRMPPMAEVGAEAGSCDVETRNFVLSNLLNKRMCSSRCALCKTVLPVFDRFPLLDGTFFLSPQSYDEAAIQVIRDGRLQFLNAACLSCLEGRGHVKCLACKRPWDGRSLVIGSMYTYDIFAAAPCCQKRLTCKCCRRAVVDINKGLDFFSQYSQMIICPYCKANDYHFIRSLPETFTVVEEGVEPICH